MERFLAFSTEVTAFTVFELRGTGQAEAYLATVTDVVGRELMDQLLDAYDRLRQRSTRTSESLRPAPRDFRRREARADSPEHYQALVRWYLV